MKLKKWFKQSLLGVVALSLLAQPAIPSVSVTVNGTSYTIPQKNEKGWGDQVTTWIQAASQHLLQKTGGTFTLSADVDFGATYGLKAPYFTSKTASPATAGVARLANTDSLGFRNAANSGNLLLGVDTSNRLTFNGSAFLPTSALTASRAVVTDSSSVLASSSVTSTELGYSSGVTSSLCGINQSCTLTNKTLTAPIIATISNTGTLTLPTSTDTLVGRATTDTLTNKTLSGNTATNLISGSGTLTLNTSGTVTVPNATDTLVGKATTDTLTNKTLSGNTATNLVSGSGTLTLNTSGTATVPNATDTLVGKATTDTLTNKTIDADGTGNSITNIENADIKSAAAIALNKLAATTASRGLVSDGSGFVSAATTTATEIGYVNGVTSAIQTQLNAKAPAASPTFTGTVTTPVTASRALVTGASSELAAATTTATEIGYVNGVTSAIQTQINTKLPTTITTTGDIIYSSSGSTAARLPIGTSNQILTTVAGVPAWAAAPSGGINYLSGNSNAESDTSGWSTYADAAGVLPVDGTGGSPNTTWTRSTSSPLRGTASFLWTKASGASRQGEGVGYPFTIDTADQAKPLAINFDYIIASGTFTAADGITAPASSGTTVTAGDSTVEVYVYDVTNAALIPVSPHILPSNSTTVPNAFKGTFQTASNSTSYRLILHTSYVTDAAMTAKFDNFFVGPQSVAYGSAMTDWVSYTPTGSWVSNTTYTGMWRRVGDMMQIQIKAIVSGAPTSATLTASLPAGYTIDTSKLIHTTSEQYTMPGSAGNAIDVGGSYYEHIVALYNNSTTVIFATQGATLTRVDQTAPFTFGANDLVECTFMAPITGWSSTTLMSNDTDTRVVAASYYGATTSLTSGDTVLVKQATKLVDTHGAYSTSTGLFTVPVSGSYRVTLGLDHNTRAGSAAYDLTGYIYKNAGAVAQTNNYYATLGATANLPVVVSTVIACVAGDTISGYGRAGSYTQSAAGGASNYLTIERLSGPATIAATESVYAKYTSSTTTIGTSNTIVIAPTKEFDSHNSYNSSTGVYTVPTSGKYRVSGSNAATITSSVNNNGIYMLARKNSTVVSEMGRHICQNTSAQGISSFGSTTISAIAGDTLDVVVYRDSNVGSFALAGSASLNWVSFERVGN